MLSGGAAASTEGSEPSTQTSTETVAIQTLGTDVAVGAPDAAFDAFLDRLMRAESNGLAYAKNPRSSALGPFQFINSTFLAVMRQHFPETIARLSESQILALRTKHEVARRAALAFSKDNMAYLMERGITPTFGHLRLAFLLGPEGAARVLKAPPGKAVAHILESAVISANPFMRRMTAADLIARATRDVSPRPSEPPRTIVAEAAPPAPVPPAPVPAQQPEKQADAGAAKAEAAPAAEPEAKTEAKPEAEVKVAEAQPEAQSKPAEAEEAAPQPQEAAPKVAEATTTAPRPGRIAARRLDRPAVINVTCDSRLASCRRWIDQEVAKLIQVARN